MSFPHGSNYLVRSRTATKQSNISLRPVIISQNCGSKQTNQQSKVTNAIKMSVVCAQTNGTTVPSQENHNVGRGPT
jgi:hypothetical protein